MEPNADDKGRFLGRTLVKEQKVLPRREQNTVFGPQDRENEKHPPGGKKYSLGSMRAEKPTLTRGTWYCPESRKHNPERHMAETPEMGGRGPSEGG